MSCLVPSIRCHLFSALGTAVSFPVRSGLRSLSGWCLQQKGSDYGRQSGGTTITCVVCDASGVFLTGSSNNPGVKYRWTVIKERRKANISIHRASKEGNICSCYSPALLG